MNKLKALGFKLHARTIAIHTAYCFNGCGYLIYIGKNKRSNFKLTYPSCATAVGFVWSNDPESYAGCSITTGRASHATQVKGDDPNKKAHPDLPAPPH
jgi:hypothetical protein